MELPSVPGGRARRSGLRPGRGRFEGEHPSSHRGSTSLARPTAGGDQALDRRPGGGRQPARKWISGCAPGALPRRRHPCRRRWLHPPGSALAHRLPPRRRSHHSRGTDAREQQALGPVRRRRSRCANRAPSCAREPLGRARRRRGRGPPSRGVERRVVQRRGVSPARRVRGGDADRRQRRPRVEDLERPGHHRPWHRLPRSGTGACLGPVACTGRAQRPRSPRAAGRRGARGRDAAPRGRASVRRAARDNRRSHGRRLQGELERTCRGRDGDRDEYRVGSGDRRDRHRGCHPAGQGDE